MTRVLAVIVTAIALAAAIISHKAASDDVYITLRIARNALEGHGLHYNIGETGVQAATSPLNLMLSVLAGRAGALVGYSIEESLLFAPAIISFLALPALALGLFVLVNRRSKNPLGPAVGAVLATLSPIVLVSVGLETQMLLALIIWALVAFDSSKYTLCGVLAGLAILARHDALILLAILVALLFFSKQRGEVMRLLGPAVLVIGPWFAYSAIALGGAVPTTLASKMAQGGTAYWPGTYYAQFWKWMVNCSFGQQWAAALICIAAAIGVVLAVRAKNNLLIALTSYFVLQFGAYSFLNVPDYHWYFAPYFVALAALSGFAMGCLRDGISTRVLAGAIFSATVIFGLRGAPVDEPRFYTYRQVGRYLNDNPPKNAAGMMEIGIIGFFASNVKVFDFSGIVTPAQIPRVSQNAAIAWIDDPSVADKVVTRMVGHPLEPDLAPQFGSLYVREFGTAPNAPFPNGIQVWRLK